jgi:hypothetical protein
VGAFVARWPRRFQRWKFFLSFVFFAFFARNDPYADIARVAPYAVNWQIKQSQARAGKVVPTNLPKLLRIIRASRYRVYLPIETIAPPGEAYDPFTLLPSFLKQVRDAIAQSA